MRSNALQRQSLVIDDTYKYPHNKGAHITSYIIVDCIYDTATATATVQHSCSCSLYTSCLKLCANQNSRHFAIRAIFFRIAAIKKTCHRPSSRHREITSLSPFLPSSLTHTHLRVFTSHIFPAASPCLRLPRPLHPRRRTCPRAHSYRIASHRIIHHSALIQALAAHSLVRCACYMCICVRTCIYLYDESVFV
jgi:hypothetical protein